MTELTTYNTFAPSFKKGLTEYANTLSFSRNASQFVKCDVRSWDDQVRVFESAILESPSNSCDIVVANAGIVGVDDLYKLDGIIVVYRLVAMYYLTRFRPRTATCETRPAHYRYQFDRPDIHGEACNALL